ncbi:MAG: disulfide bond formation protein B [Gammaproteobacteria bacterium]|nr:disulfide bond formation protein B [Gammaproteobacteria bacterium]MCH9744162.1 disulfide bond formation protein B [Gammaproteobacteria bacterium]
MKLEIERFFGRVAIFDTCVGLCGILAILIASLVVQFVAHEAPCPLCLLQRAAFIAIGLCLLMNLRYGHQVSHWGLAILCACSGIAVSIRQILLHVNNPKGFGEKVWGLHTYSWAFIGFFVTIIGCSLVLMLCSARR